MKYSSKYKTTYRESLEYLDETHPFFYTYVINLGEPNWVRQDEGTAYIKWDKKSSKWEYYINSNFAESIGPEDLAFVSGHEALHIALEHIKVYNDYKEYFSDKKRFNVACDLVVNDILLDLGFKKPNIEGILYGEDVVGYTTERVNLFDVYNDIPQDKLDEIPDEEDENGEPQYSPSFGKGDMADGEGEGSGGEGDDDGDNNGNGKSDSHVDKKIEEQKQQTEDGWKAAGASFSVGNINKELEKASKGWKDLLKKVDPNILKKKGPVDKYSFHQTPRKLTGMHNPYGLNGIIPDKVRKKPKNGKMPTLVMFMDCSGSCSQYTQQFIKLASSVPRDDINLLCWTFSTRTMKLDLDAKNQRYASGGTAFSPIEVAIQNEVVKEIGEYPKSVIVVTDGYASFDYQQVPEQYKNRWHWLLIGQNGYQQPGPFGTNHQFKDIFK